MFLTSKPVFVVEAQIQTRKWEGVCVNNEVATIQGVQCLIANLLSIAVTVVGMVGFIMIIIGAFKFLLSGSSSKGTEEGRNTIGFAIIGLVVALSAYFILNIVASFTGVKSILQFRVSTDQPATSSDPDSDHVIPF